MNVEYSFGNIQMQTSQAPQAYQPLQEQKITVAALKTLEDCAAYSAPFPFEFAITDLTKQIEDLKKTIYREECVECGSGLMAAGAVGCCVSSFCVAQGLFIASCLTGSHLSLYGAYVLSGLGCSFPAPICCIGSKEASIRIAKDEDKKEILERAVKNLNRPEYKEFIQSQNYQNLEELLRLPSFHQYVETCMALKEDIDTKNLRKLEKRVQLMKLEENLVRSLSKKIDGFKRIEYSKH